MSLTINHQPDRQFLDPSAGVDGGEIGATTGDDFLEELDDDGEEEVEYFNPEMAEVYRIISCDTPTVSHATARSSADIVKPSTSSYSGEESPDIEDGVQYLVKWRGLSYAESTWERFEDLKVRKRLTVGEKEREIKLKGESETDR